MSKNNQKLKLGFLILALTAYIIFIFASFSSADPQGAGVSFISSSNYTVAPDAQTHDGGTINTVTLDVVQQDNAWKAYVGNITGSLVLRNSDGWSIFEWSLNSSTMGGNIYVSRNDSVTWGNLKCANDTIIASEHTFLGMGSSDPDSINNTFNYTTHDIIETSIAGIGGGTGNISNSTCPSTATWVNGSAQTMSESAYFQEILLYDNTNLVYTTFVFQDAWGYNNNESVGGSNVTYDFQLILAEDRVGSGTTYYFFAEII